MTTLSIDHVVEKNCRFVYNHEQDECHNVLTISNLWLYFVNNGTLTVGICRIDEETIRSLSITYYFGYHFIEYQTYVYVHTYEGDLKCFHNGQENSVLVWCLILTFRRSIHFFKRQFSVFKTSENQAVSMSAKQPFVAAITFLFERNLFCQRCFQVWEWEKVVGDQIR